MPVLGDGEMATVKEETSSIKKTSGIDCGRVAIV